MLSDNAKNYLVLARKCILNSESVSKEETDKLYIEMDNAFNQLNLTEKALVNEMIAILYDDFI